MSRFAILETVNGDFGPMFDSRADAERALAAIRQRAQLDENFPFPDVDSFEVVELDDEGFPIPPGQEPVRARR